MKHTPDKSKEKKGTVTYFSFTTIDEEGNQKIGNCNIQGDLSSIAGIQVKYQAENMHGKLNGFMIHGSMVFASWGELRRFFSPVMQSDN